MKLFDLKFDLGISTRSDRFKLRLDCPLGQPVQIGRRSLAKLSRPQNQRSHACCKPDSRNHTQSRLPDQPRCVNRKGLPRASDRPKSKLSGTIEPSTFLAVRPRRGGTADSQRGLRPRACKPLLCGRTQDHRHHSARFGGFRRRPWGRNRHAESHEHSLLADSRLNDTQPFTSVRRRLAGNFRSCCRHLRARNHCATVDGIDGGRTTRRIGELSRVSGFESLRTGHANASRNAVTHRQPLSAALVVGRTPECSWQTQIMVVR